MPHLVVNDAGLAQGAHPSAFVVLSEGSVNISRWGEEPSANCLVCRILVEAAEVPFENALVL